MQLFHVWSNEAVFEGGTSGIFRFVVKFDIPGFNWLFLTIFDFATICTQTMFSMLMFMCRDPWGYYEPSFISIERRWRGAYYSTVRLTFSRKTA